jgi:hypothetical protein
LAIDDLPLPVVNLLNVIGVPWPYINEDAVMRFSSLVRSFGRAVRTTHEDATRHVAGVAEAYRSAASERMTEGWARLSARHVTEITDGCEVAAVALEAAAGYIVVQKAAAVETLIGMATAFAGDQVAAAATFGLAEAAVPLIIKGAEKVVDSLAVDLEQYLISKVAEAALKPLQEKVGALLAGLDWSESGAPAVGGSGFGLDATAALTHASGLDDCAARMRSHVRVFSEGIRGLVF